MKEIETTHIKARTESKHNTKNSHQIKKEESKRRRKEQKRTRKQLTKCSKYIPINNYFKCKLTMLQSKDIEWLNA